jgi:hypothetical protein
MSLRATVAAFALAGATVSACGVTGASTAVPAQPLTAYQQRLAGSASERASVCKSQMYMSRLGAALETMHATVHVNPLDERLAEVQENFTGRPDDGRALSDMMVSAADETADRVAETGLVGSQQAAILAKSYDTVDLQACTAAFNPNARQTASAPGSAAPAPAGIATRGAGTGSTPTPSSSPAPTPSGTPCSRSFQAVVSAFRHGDIERDVAVSLGTTRTERELVGRALDRLDEVLDEGMSFVDAVPTAGAVFNDYCASHPDARAKPTKSGPPPVPAAATDCGIDVAGQPVHAGSTTSCAFALAVSAAFAEAGGPPTPQVQAVSPVTGDSYTMSCSLPNPVVICRGGTNAAVYIG